MPPKGSTRQKKQPDDKAVMGPLAPYYSGTDGQNTGAGSNAASGGGATTMKRGAEGGHAVPAAKRRRMADEVSVSSAGGGGGGGAAYASTSRRAFDVGGHDDSRIKIDLCALTNHSLQQYLTKHNLVPPMYPGPLSTSNPPLPYYLVNPPPPPARSSSPSPPASVTTPANRPRREPTRTSRENGSNRRRSSRLADEEGIRDPRHPIMWDLEDGKRAMAEIAQRHFDKEPIRESDAMIAFVYAVRTQDRSLKILPQ